jgi:hypothetical protein
VSSTSIHFNKRKIHILTKKKYISILDDFNTEELF